MKRCVLLFTYLLHDGQSPRKEDCICMIVTHFIGTGGFFIRYSNGHTK